MKWIFFYVKPAFIFGRLYPGPYCAPSLLIGLINMFMLKARDVKIPVRSIFIPARKPRPDATRNALTAPPQLDFPAGSLYKQTSRRRNLFRVGDKT
ncbi:hypothetical protein COOONC_20349 [Cooperia oncophora]